MIKPLIASALISLMPIKGAADTLTVINNHMVVIDNLVEPNPSSLCMEERLSVTAFVQTLYLMLNADVSTVIIGETAQGIPIVKLENLITGEDGVQMLVNQNLARTNQHPFWCK